MDEIGGQLSDFINSMNEAVPQKTGLMQYFKAHYREVMIMKDCGYTSKQITDYLNGQVVAGKLILLNKPVSVVYFNKAWREFCIKKNISTKPTETMMQQLENEIFNYRDVLAPKKPAATVDVVKASSPAQETALQLAELIKFLLELLRQNTGRDVVKLGDASAPGADGVLAKGKETDGDPPQRKASDPPPSALGSLGKGRLASFFDEEC